MKRPLAIDLFCGLGGWADGLLAEGWDVIGFDIERHNYGAGGYPGQLVLRDVLTLHGSQFRDADLIVASPPCQEFSYMAMPWKRGKQIARALRGEDTFPEPYRGSRSIAQLTALFDTCFRIQREASAAAGHMIPLIIENVKGAQPWVGQAAWSFGSFYLWGDVPALMPQTGFRKLPGNDLYYKTGKSCGKLTDPRYGAIKVPGMDWSKYGTPGYKAVAFNDKAIRQLGRKGFKKEWRDCEMSMMPSKSPRRKAASAQIAKIPFPLAVHIARVFKP